MVRYLLFDLDGTLLDTYEGVARSVVHALQSLGKPIPDQRELRRYLGPPLLDSFAKIAGLRETEIEQAIFAYRERYETVGVYEYGFFEEPLPTLEKLRERGFVLTWRRELEHGFDGQIFACPSSKSSLIRQY